MASGKDFNATDYIQHHLTFLTKPVGEGEFWALNVDSIVTGAVLGMLALGVVCTGVAYILYFRLIERAGPARALAVTFVVPVFALTYGGLFLGEQLTLWMLVCGVIIICGTALATGLLKLGK